MPRPRQEGMTDRETELIQVIWAQSEATVDDIRKAIPRSLADSTVRTLLKIMLGKGYIVSKLVGRQRVYSAKVPRQEAQASALRRITRSLFEGSPGKLVARLVEDEQISLEELEELRRGLEDKAREGQP
jgi:predicted transcriptional regulator